MKSLKVAKCVMLNSKVIFYELVFTFVQNTADYCFVPKETTSLSGFWQEQIGKGLIALFDEIMKFVFMIFGAYAGKICLKF